MSFEYSWDRHLKRKFFLEKKIVYYLKYVKDNIIYFFLLSSFLWTLTYLQSCFHFAREKKRWEWIWCFLYSIKHCPMIYSKLFEYFLQYFSFWSDTFWFSEHDVLHLEYVRLLKTCEKGTWSEYNFMFKGVDLVGESTSVRICKRILSERINTGKRKNIGRDIF